LAGQRTVQFLGVGIGGGQDGPGSRQLLSSVRPGHEQAPYDGFAPGRDRVTAERAEASCPRVRMRILPAGSRNLRNRAA
jgi:hypothetical protein